MVKILKGVELSQGGGTDADTETPLKTIDLVKEVE